MDISNISNMEADEVIRRWADYGMRVVFAMEIGHLACFIQRAGHVECPRPGIVIHQSGETSTTIWTAKYGEIVFLDDTHYEGLRFRSPAGFDGYEIILVADINGDLTPDSLLILSQMISK
jgi:hypothetical protein